MTTYHCPKPSCTWSGPDYRFCPTHGNEMVESIPCSCGGSFGRGKSWPYCPYCGKTEEESDQAKADAAQAGAEARAYDTAEQEATGN